MFNVWVANLGKYNEGDLVGEWWDLEEVEDFDLEFEELRSRIGLSDEPDERGVYYEEYAVFDWECDLPGVEYTQYPNLEEWWEMAREWAGLLDYEQTYAKIFDEACGGDFRECVDGIEKVICHPGCDDMSDVAKYYVSLDFECYGLDSDKFRWIQNYFDYKAYGKMLEMDNFFVQHDGTMYEVLAR